MSSREGPSSFPQGALGAVEPWSDSRLPGMGSSLWLWACISSDWVVYLNSGWIGRGATGVCDAPGKAEMNHPGSLECISLKRKTDSATFPLLWETRLKSVALFHSWCFHFLKYYLFLQRRLYVQSLASEHFFGLWEFRMPTPFKDGEERGRRKLLKTSWGSREDFF